MWVFGYGSLMWDGWEIKLGCSQKLPGEVQGYQRTFNKASIENWGSKRAPCPTLNLKRVNGAICRGIAFEFSNGNKSKTFDYLKRREGKYFTFPELPVRLDNGTEITAHVPIYNGNNYVIAQSEQEIASIVQRAQGKNGSCLKYIQGIANELTKLGIHDAVVNRLWRIIKDADIS